MTVEIERAGNRIYLRSTRPTPGLSKTVPGANWSNTKKIWSIPLSLEHCLALRDRFGSELSIGPGLWEWAKEERARRAEMGALGMAGTATLTRVEQVAPTLYAAMKARPYQLAGAAFIARGQNVLVADEPGLGKTLEAIAGVIESGIPGPYLVVCPKTATSSVWGREIPRWYPGQEVVLVPDGRDQRNRILNLADQRATSNTWFVVHPEMLRTKSWWICSKCGGQTKRKAGRVELDCLHDAKGHKTRHDHTFPQLFAQDWGVVICDESDRALIRKTRNLTLVRTGMEMVRTRPGGIRIALSGTPFRSRPHLLWSTLNWLDPTRHTAMWSWVETYWEVQTGGYTGTAKTIGTLRPDREGRLWDSLKPILLRRTKAEVAPDLPPKSYPGSPLYPADPNSPNGIWLEMTPEQARAHQEMLQTSVARLAQGQLGAIGVLAEFTRLKQLSSTYGRMVEESRHEFCKDPAVCPQGPAKHRHLINEMAFKPALPSNKYEWLENFLDQMGFPEAPTGKVIVASQYTEILELFAQSLKLPSVLLTGSVTGRRRQEAIDSLNRPVGEGDHLMFLNTKAGGVAITLDYADDMVILDETWSPDDQTQLEDRIHRVSRPRPVRYHYLRSAGSVEEQIALANAELKGDAARLLDGRRGIDLLEQLCKR